MFLQKKSVFLQKNPFFYRKNPPFYRKNVFLQKKSAFLQKKKVFLQKKSALNSTFKQQKPVVLLAVTPSPRGVPQHAKGVKETGPIFFEKSATWGLVHGFVIVIYFWPCLALKKPPGIVG